MLEDTFTEKMADEFFREFGRDATFVARAPGRVNLIGEHTDYNDGLVLPMAINRNIEILFAPRNDSVVNLHSINFEQSHQFKLDENLVKDNVAWANYFKAVAFVLLDSGYSLKGLDAVVYGDIPVASGLSSSAAVEVACILAMLTAAEIDLPKPLSIAKLAQRSEREFIGVMCGLMDQFISAAAIAKCALKIDCQTMQFETITIPSELSIVVADTKLSRTLAGSAYNQRCAECEQALAILKRNLGHRFPLNSMKEVGLEVVEAGKDLLPEKLYRRVRHIATENHRVQRAADALRQGDLATLGTLFNESHASLRDDYQVSSEGLDQITGVLRTLPGCFGARLTGAGFGGCAIAAVASEQVPSFIESAEAQLSERSPQPTFFQTNAQSGGSVRPL